MLGIERLFEMICNSFIPILVGGIMALIGAINKHRSDFSLLLGLIALISGGFVVFVTDQFCICRNYSPEMRVVYAGIIGGGYNQILISFPKIAEKFIGVKGK